MRQLLIALGLTAACSADPPEVSNQGESRATASAGVGEVPAGALKSVRKALSRSSAQLKMRNRTDGIKELEIVEGFQHATMVVRAADGSRHIECVDDAERAAELLEKGLQ